MLTQQEQKMVVSTLGKRRAWLRKTLEDGKLEAGARQDAIESLKLLDSALKKLANFTENKTKPAPAPAQITTDTKRKALTLETARILVAEDNKDSAKLLLDILVDMGIKQVDVAHNGIDAFDNIKNAGDQPYDLILCDWDMPELTGLEVHSKAKASNTLKGAHFIMVTAVSEASRIRQAITQGINDYIVKPIDVDILEDKIKTAIGNMAATGT